MLSIDERKRAIDDNISPDWIDKQSDQIETIAVSFLVFNQTLSVCLVFSNSSESAHKMRAWKMTCVYIVRVNIFAKSNIFSQLVLPLPNRFLSLVLTAKRWRTAWELKVLEVNIIQLFLTIPVSLKWPHHINWTS